MSAAPWPYDALCRIGRCSAVPGSVQLQVFIDHDVAPIDVTDGDDARTAATMDRLSLIDENGSTGTRRPAKSRVKLHRWTVAPLIMWCAGVRRHGRSSDADGSNGTRMDSLSDAETGELVSRARAGDAEAWEKLTDRYIGLLWSLGRGMRLSHTDTADAVQTTWLRLVEHLDDLRNPEGIGSWLVTTMRRECLGALRRSTRTTTVDGLDDIPAGGDELDDALLRNERDAALWRAFAGLQPRCQALLRVLMSDPSPTYAEVSAALDMPVGSIGPTRQRCLALLRDSVMAAAYPFGAPSPGST
jgi:RNA polymerase sigma factor (sigma-70 family)